MNFVALAGGVGGAKMADGLARSVGPEHLTVIVNTGDDFELYGLKLSPDLDTVMYTLAGIANPENGWGLAGETWTNYAMLEGYGANPWFRLGDRDLATHMLRTQALRAGDTLTQVTEVLSKALGVVPRVLPMSDDRVRTVVDTDTGTLAFQEYFVRLRWQPRVTGVRFEGVERAEATLPVLRAHEMADLIVLCPSNPYLSVDPILLTRGVRDAMMNASAPIIAVSPIVGGEAIKGPAAKMMRELGQEPSAATVARHYAEFINGFVLDVQDAQYEAAIQAMGLGVLVTNTVMKDLDDRARLGCEIVNFADELRPEKLGGCRTA